MSTPLNLESCALLLKSFRLPTMAAMVDETIRQAENENWGYRRFLQRLCEGEYQDRQMRKHGRLLKLSQLPSGRSLTALDLNLVPEKARRQLATLLDGSFVDRAENVIAFGLPGRGKTFFMQVLCHELVIRHGIRVLFVPAYRLVQQLLEAKSQMRLERAIRKLSRYQVVFLDDIGYVQQSREEMEVLFTFLAERYESRSVMITSNLVFSQWDQIFKDPMTTMAAVDRLVHHATILEFYGESIRAQQAKRASTHGISLETTQTEDRQTEK